MICTHQSWWLSRTGNGIQDPESHDQDSARTSCEIPPCPVGNAGFTAPSSVWLFLGSQPSGRSCSWKCSAIWKSDAKMNSIHLATPCKTSGLNDLPRPTEQAFGRTQICRAPFRRLNRDSVPCPAAFVTALNSHSK